MRHLIDGNSSPSHSQHSLSHVQYFNYFAFAVIIFVIKIWLIHTFGNETPFWDQWDAEAELLYKPFLSGSLSSLDFFSLHNEHRIFTTRLLALLLFRVNGFWSPILQMYVNALLHVAAIVLGIVLISRVIGHRHTSKLLAFSLCLFGIPYGWENTLAGFQSQFYFYLLFGFASLWFLTSTRSLSLAWWVGVVCAILSFLSLSSGALMPAAAATVGFLLFWFGRSEKSIPTESSIKQLLSVFILAGLFVTGAIMTPSLAGHAYLKAGSFSQFFAALIAVLSWPISPSLISAMVRNFPSFIFIGYMFWKLPPKSDLKWFLLALVVWMFAQSVVMSYGRAVGVLSSRYLDVFSIFILVNFACLIFLVEKYKLMKQVIKISSLSIWALFILFALILGSINSLREELNFKRLTGNEQEENVRSYLCTRNMSHLKDKPFLFIPYPDPEGLAGFLDDPTIRSILPPRVYPAGSTYINSDGSITICK